MNRYFLPFVALIALASDAGAAQWTLTTADFRSQSVTLKSIDAAGVHVSAGGEEKLISFDHFLELNRPSAATQPGGKFTLYMLGQDHVSGEPVAIKGNDLIWNNPTLGQIALPMKRLTAMTLAGVLPPDAKRKEDVVTLANGDTLHGIITDIASGKVTVQTDAGNSEVPVASISQISFAATAGAAAVPTGFRIRLDDDSAVIAASIKAADEKIELTFGKDIVQSVDINRVTYIEPVNGPVSWLSSRATSESIYIPFVGSPRNGAAKMDRDWTGQEPIRFGTEHFAHGIGVHSYSRLSWDLDGTFEAVRTRYAIDTGQANTIADVTVRILLDGKVVYEQPHVRAGTLSPVIVVDIKSAMKLTLEVDYGDNMDTQDRLNWIEPALLKHKPTAKEDGASVSSQALLWALQAQPGDAASFTLQR